jgi:uncharacterized protein (TIGR02118 family)
LYGFSPLTFIPLKKALLLVTSHSIWRKLKPLSTTYIRRSCVIKLIALLKRKPGLSREEFAQRWVYEHTKLSSKLPGLLEYRINLATASQPEAEGTEPLYDGTAELWWESLEAMEAAFASEIGKVAGADADEFCDLRLHLYTEEHFIVTRKV